MAAKRILGIFVCLCMLFYTNESRRGVSRSDGAKIIKNLLGELSDRQLGESLQSLPNGQLGSLVQSISSRKLIKIIHGFPKKILGHLIKGIPYDEKKKLFKDVGLPQAFLNSTKALSDKSLGKLADGLPGIKLARAVKKIDPEVFGKLLQNKIPSSELGKRVKKLSGRTILALLQSGSYDEGAEIVKKLILEIPDERLGEFVKRLPSRQLGRIVQCIPNDELKNFFRSLRKKILGRLVKGLSKDELKQLYKDFGLPGFVLKPTLELPDASFGSLVDVLPGIKLAQEIKKLNPEELGYLIKENIPSSEFGKRIKALSGSTILNILEGRRCEEFEGPENSSESDGDDAFFRLLKKEGLLKGLLYAVDGLPSELPLLGSGKLLANDSVVPTLLKVVTGRGSKGGGLLGGVLGK